MGAQLSGPSGGSRFDLKQNAEINVTPFVDVMLVLLIIFMVSAPLATVSIKVDLPPAQNNPTNEHKKPTFISVASNGDVFISGEYSQKTTLERLAADLTARLGGGDHTKDTVLVRADRGAKYEKFMDVVNQLQTDGFYKIGLIVEDAAPGEV